MPCVMLYKHLNNCAQNRKVRVSGSVQGRTEQNSHACPEVACTIKAGRHVHSRSGSSVF